MILLPIDYEGYIIERYEGANTGNNERLQVRKKGETEVVGLFRWRKYNYRSFVKKVEEAKKFIDTLKI